MITRFGEVCTGVSVPNPCKTSDTAPKTFTAQGQIPEASLHCHAKPELTNDKEALESTASIPKDSRAHIHDSMLKVTRKSNTFLALGRAPRNRSEVQANAVAAGASTLFSKRQQLPPCTR